MAQCVACGQKIETVGLYDNHHCAESFEKRRQMIDRREQSVDHLNRKPTEAMRINYGFYLLSLSGSW